MEVKSLFKNILVLLFSMSSSFSIAQKERPADDIVNDFASTLDSLPKKQAGKKELLQQLEQKFSINNPALDSVQLDRQLKQYDFTAMHQKRCFTWQFYSSIFIFVIVMLIVGMGLFLSYKQFQLLEVQIKDNLLKPKAETTSIGSETTNIEI